MAKLIVVALAFAALVAFASAYTTIVTTTIDDQIPYTQQSQQCQQQLQQKQFNQCHMYLQQGQGFFEDNRSGQKQQSQILQQCCNELQNVHQQCQCEAVKQVFQDVQQIQGQVGAQRSTVDSRSSESTYQQAQPSGSYGPLCLVINKHGLSNYHKKCINACKSLKGSETECQCEASLQEVFRPGTDAYTSVADVVDTTTADIKVFQGDLYPVTQPSHTPHALLSVSPSTWHQRLGHPGEEVLRSLVSRQFISCNKEKSHHICHACQLGKHVRLPFSSSDSVVTRCFEIVHSDIWTSPIVSSGGFKYYVLFLDHYSHYLWLYPLRTKSEVFQKFLHFRSYVNNQFKCDITAFQCDHGGEFDNTNLFQLFAQHGIQFRFSCPKTSQQNGHTTQSGQTTFPHQLITHSTQSTSGPNIVHQPTRTHPMVTRAQVGTVKPNPRFHGHTSHISPLPKYPVVALCDSNWRDAMYDKYNALIKNSTWILVPKPPNANVVRSMWLFRHKYHVDGSLSRYKARLVANGRSQQYGVDCDDTFSPVVKPATIRTVLSLALSRNWPIHQLDVKNAFLNGDLSETVYMYQPPGFVDPRFPHHVCRLQRSLYGLKQAPRAWFQRFAGYALRVGFSSSRCVSSLFIYQHVTPPKSDCSGTVILGCDVMEQEVQVTENNLQKETFLNFISKCFTIKISEFKNMSQQFRNNSKVQT
ncbi:ribonuclease H-like domain-containing protein [Tanacetum coccineum]